MVSLHCCIDGQIWNFEEAYLGPSSLRQCDSSGEDPTCADSVPPTEYKKEDHIVYLGVPIGPTAQC
eukprot:m.886982 g.886982  ORF g.886982 m.886982 type:complete len:66 (-) comp59916_c1_seq6:5272-5469(-)